MVALQIFPSDFHPTHPKRETRTTFFFFFQKPNQNPPVDELRAFRGVSFLGGLFCLWHREFQPSRVMKNSPQNAASCPCPRMSPQSHQAGCKHPPGRAQTCRAHVGASPERRSHYSPKTPSPNIFCIIITQNEWKLLPPSPQPQKHGPL